MLPALRAGERQILALQRDYLGYSLERPPILAAMLTWWPEERSMPGRQPSDTAGIQYRSPIVQCAGSFAPSSD